MSLRFQAEAALALFGGRDSVVGDGGWHSEECSSLKMGVSKLLKGTYLFYRVGFSSGKCCSALPLWALLKSWRWSVLCRDRGQSRPPCDLAAWRVEWLGV